MKAITRERQEVQQWEEEGKKTPDLKGRPDGSTSQPSRPGTGPTVKYENIDSAQMQFHVERVYRSPCFRGCHACFCGAAGVIDFGFMDPRWARVVRGPRKSPRHLRFSAGLWDILPPVSFFLRAKGDPDDEILGLSHRIDDKECSMTFGGKKTWGRGDKRQTPTIPPRRCRGLFGACRK